MFRGVALHTPHFMGDIMIHNIILITASMGVIAFGFLCFQQGEYILTEQSLAQCFETVGYTSIWIDDLAILVLTSMASTLCLGVVITEVAR